MESLNHKKKSHRLLRDAIIMIFVLMLAGYVVLNIEGFFRSPEEASEYIRSLGLLGPVAAIAVLVLEVVVAPIPGFLVAIATGFAFGGTLGTIYTYLGNLLGTSAAFFLSRRFGRPLVEHLVEKEKLSSYDRFFREKGMKLLWVVYLIPIFPADVVTFVTGLTALKYGELLLITSIAFIPSIVVFNFFGAALLESGLGSIAIMAGTLVFVLIVLGWLGYHYIYAEGTGKDSSE
jgi:uncharacterized membrane protein YdjX (TVP38/TMEM64 family)